MSFCRFSDDCDIYAYPSGDKYAVHLNNNVLQEYANDHPILDAFAGEWFDNADQVEAALALIAVLAPTAKIPEGLAASIRDDEEN